MSNYNRISRIRLIEIHQRIRSGFYFSTEVYEVIAAKVLKKLKLKK